MSVVIRPYITDQGCLKQRTLTLISLTLYPTGETLWIRLYWTITFDTSWFQLLPWGVERNSFKKHPSLWGTLLGNFGKSSDILSDCTRQISKLKNNTSFFWLFYGSGDPDGQHSHQKSKQGVPDEDQVDSHPKHSMFQTEASPHIAQGCRLHIYK